MEQAFGADFGGVRVHTDTRASSVNDSLHARAFTRGQDLFFRQGEYDPSSSAGRELIAHELTHVVQQRAGRVHGPQGQGTQGTQGARLSVNPALEAEADAAGARAARGEAAGPVTTGSSACSPGAVAQPKLGLELEMLVLTDIAGRPAPEKVLLGTYGNLDLVVDRSATLTAEAPVRAARAPYRTVDIPKSPPGKGTKRVLLGPYDLPIRYKSRRRPAKGPDPRPVRHALRTLAERGTEQPSKPERVLDIWVKDYVKYADNWEQDLALASLKGLRVVGRGMMRRHPELTETIQPMLDEGARHERKWKSSLLKPENIEGLMREVSPVGREEWSPKHPVAEGLTGEGYDSIVEIVTKAYDPETEQGSAALIADMTAAADLAGKIEVETENFTKRVPLESVGGVTPKARRAFVGSEKVSTGEQSTAASIQSTMAVELKELYGFFLAGMGGHEAGVFGPRAFGIKHQSIVDVATDVGQAAPQVAWRVLEELQPRSEVPDDLLGLLTLMAQYLLMGARFEEPGLPQLDKNAVSLLSRTDLAKIYRLNVREPEKEWVTPQLEPLQQSLLRHTGRKAGDLLLTPAKRPPLPQATRLLKCGTFIDNIFTEASDGFTPHLDEGIFKQMGPEAIPDDSESGRVKRTAPVFELRNMIAPDGDRFPRDQWVPLTEDLVTLLTKLNTRGYWKELGL